MNADISDSYASYSAPKQDGQCLIIPDLSWAKQHLKQCTQSSADKGLGGSCSTSFISKWQALAKTEILSQALSYTSTYRDVSGFHEINDLASKPIVLSGHQPELFHCGVWLKYFLTARLAEATGSVAINFIVDNDLCRFPGIQIPTVVDRRLVLKFVAFDQTVDPMPWENRKLIDIDTWRTFGSRVERALPETEGQPILRELWQHAICSDRNLPLGLLLSQARNLLELNAGLRTLEVPLSQLCRTRSFAAFSLYLLEQADALRSAYNSELESYRLAHRIRNHAQPLPNLVSRDGWTEVPWWCYGESSDRRPLFVKSQSGAVRLSDLQGWQVDFSGLPDSDSAIERWLAIEDQGIKIRPRALMTTMFTRLLMSDLFVHGIGGGKYDQITDRMIRRIFDTTPPAMIVASATLELKLKGLPDGLDQPVDTELQNAELLFKSASANPELLLNYPSLLSALQSSLDPFQALASQKQQLLASIPDKGEKWDWHNAMKRVKQQLSEVSRPALAELAQRIELLKDLGNQQALLNCREYSYCLFELDKVQSVFGQFIQPIS